MHGISHYQAVVQKRTATLPHNSPYYCLCLTKQVTRKGGTLRITTQHHPYNFRWIQEQWCQVLTQWWYLTQHDKTVHLISNCYFFAWTFIFANCYRLYVRKFAYFESKDAELNSTTLPSLHVLKIDSIPDIQLCVVRDKVKTNSYLARCVVFWNMFCFHVNISYDLWGK